MPSIINHVKQLESDGYIRKEEGGIYSSFVANKTDSFKMYKKNDILLRLDESGLVEYLDEQLSPNAIVLFGSASRGEDIETSDIDIFILAKEKELNLKKFETKLKRKVKLFFEDKIEDVPKELLNNLVNGIVLKGYMRIVR